MLTDKLSIITDELDQDLSHVLLAMRQTAFTGAEIRSVDETPPHLMSEQQASAIRGTLADAGVSVSGFCPPVFKCPLPTDDEAWAEAAQVLRDSLSVARAVGSPRMRIFSFYRTGEPQPEQAARAVRAVLDSVDTTGVDLLLETGTRTNTPTVRHSLAFLEALGEDRVGILWDPGNSVFSGWDPEPYPSEYELGKAVIRHVHVKDPAGRSGYVRIGDGELPWQSIVRRLHEDGYEGWLSLETHWRIGRVLTGPQRDVPWGSDFSDDGFEASVECMQVLRNLVSAL